MPGYGPLRRIRSRLSGRPELTPKYPTIENLVAATPDLFFAGWYYGMRPGGDVTPETLAPHGIKTLILTESCVHLDKSRPTASLDLLYTDVKRLGRIFGKDAEAAALVAGWKARVAEIKAAVGDVTGKRVFLYDSGEDKPFTAGRFAMPTAMIEALGATNITADMDTSSVGVFLMLRRMSLTGDAMACAILPGAAVGYLVAGLSLGAMTVGGLIAGMTVALLAGFVTRVTALREDASLAAFYLISLAVGVLIVSTRGSNVDLMHVLFGTVLALDDAALTLLCSFASVSVFALAALFRPLVLECADPQFLCSVSGLSAMTHFTFLALVVLNLVAGFHALGTLMAVGIMILPAAAARFWAVGIGALIAVAVLLAMLSSLSGLLLSYHVSLPSGPAIILVAGLAYALSLVFGPVGGLAGRAFPRRYLEA